MDAVRIGHTLFNMTSKDAVSFGVTEENRCHYVRLDGGKANMSARSICLEWNIDHADLAGKLFLNSGLERRLIVAKEDRQGFVLATPDVTAVIEEIRRNDIACLIVDPFVRCHAVAENDHEKIDFVAAQFSKIAATTGCAISLVHHTRKPSTRL